MTTGEVIVGSEPPGGIVNADDYPNFDRFTVTFDQPAYVYIADISVELEGNEARRQRVRSSEP